MHCCDTGRSKEQRVQQMRKEGASFHCDERLWTHWNESITSRCSWSDSSVDGVISVVLLYGRKGCRKEGLEFKAAP